MLYLGLARRHIFHT